MKATKLQRENLNLSDELVNLINGGIEKISIDA